jgi:hypothetical protein
MGIMVVHFGATKRLRDRHLDDQATTPKRQNRTPPNVSLAPIGCAITGWLLVGSTLAAAASFGLYQLLGSPGLPTLKSFSSSELLDLLRITLTVVAGFGGVIALTVALRRQRVGEATHELALHQEERERTKALNERFGVASAQLGNDNFAVRLAGVYSMVALAEEWPTERQMCIDVLCGYLRAPYSSQEDTEGEVRSAIIQQLTQATSKPVDEGWDGITINFTGLNLKIWTCPTIDSPGSFILIAPHLAASEQVFATRVSQGTQHRFATRVSSPTSPTLATAK